MDRTFERHIVTNDFKSEAEYYNHLMHLATYQFGSKYAKGKRVLDYGCGSGYGSLILSKDAETVIAIDTNKDAIQYAKSNYSRSNLIYKDVSELTDEKFDLITSFQVIEHVDNVKKYIETLRSLLKPAGYLLLSTPDRKNRLFKYIQKPPNIYHKREYSKETIRRQLIKYFDKIEILKITSKREFVMKEILRTRKQRIISLPCSLVFYPDSLRVMLLRLQSETYNWIVQNRIKKEMPENEVTRLEDLKSKYTIADIIITDDPEIWTDLLVICS
jgi:2-polyprenyl-3-methyl-5-hydroxy-6-metoxy-1,4-benzoquinol methylase